MGWGKTLAAGIGGFLVGGPLGAAAAASAVAAYDKHKENEEIRESTNREAGRKEDSHKQIKESHDRRLKAQKEREEAEKSEFSALEQQQKDDARRASERVAQAALQRDQLMIACLAVGMAAGTVDGDLSADESGELHDLLNSLRGDEEFSQTVQAKIEEYEKNPPTFMKAKKEVDKVQNADLRFFRKLIVCIIRSDNETSLEEVDFLEKWDHFYPETCK